MPANSRRICISSVTSPALYRSSSSATFFAASGGISPALIARFNQPAETQGKRTDAPYRAASPYLPSSAAYLVIATSPRVAAGSTMAIEAPSASCLRDSRSPEPTRRIKSPASNATSGSRAARLIHCRPSSKGSTKPCADLPIPLAVSRMFERVRDAADLFVVSSRSSMDFFHSRR